MDRADRLIAKYHLHDGDALVPVNMDGVIEAIHAEWCYTRMSPMVYARTSRWREGREKFTDINYSSRLSAPAMSAIKRHATAHEFAHIFCRHCGDYFIMWRRGIECRGFEKWADNKQEAQCEVLSSYFLVRMEALFEIGNEGSRYVALVLDVPAHLVEIRWAIWRRFGR